MTDIFILSQNIIVGSQWYIVEKWRNGEWWGRGSLVGESDLAEGCKIFAKTFEKWQPTDPGELW